MFHSLKLGLGLGLLWAAQVAFGQATLPVPFEISLEEVVIEGMPDLQSAVVAEYQGKILMVAGRTNGMHGFPAGKAINKAPSFPRKFANETAYVIDPVAGKVLGQESVSGLGGDITNQLKTTNSQSLVDGDWLYILGGYGDYSQAQTLVTLPQALAVDLPAFIQAVEDPLIKLDAAFAKAHIGVVTSNEVKVTGGDLLKLGNQFMLVLGQLYDGEYSTGGGNATQIYTHCISNLNMSAAKQGGAVQFRLELVGKNPASPNLETADGPYHRRDLTVEYAISPNGTPEIGVYGGVFKGGDFEGYLHPMYASMDYAQPGELHFFEDTAGFQWLSQYHCAVIPLYDQSAGTMYTTFFGGISQYYWDEARAALVHDAIDLPKGIDGLPFINSVSTLKVAPGNAGGRVTTQYLHPDLVFPPKDAQPECGVGDNQTKKAAYLGAETAFKKIGGQGVYAYSNGVLNLNLIKKFQSQTGQPTVIGYLLGGIAAVNPYGPPSCASNKVYRVSLNTLVTQSKAVDLTMVDRLNHQK